MQKKQINKGTWIGMLIATVLTLLTIGITVYMDDIKGYIASVLIIFYSMIPFYMSFESRKPQARELVTIAVLTALASISRVIFIAVPHFKPIIGMIIIAGIGMGPGAGFMTGSLSAIVSNIVFGQGPWTPWQMFSYGIAGFIAGVLAKKGIIKGEKPLVAAIVGIFIDMLIVGPLLDTCALFLMPAGATNTGVLSIYASGVPVNAIRASATFLTVLIFGKPMVEKLDRIKIKYGMVDEENEI